MTSSVLLSAALRGNILALRDTQSQIAEAQLRIATGLKVNSAIDNPRNFFQASALNASASRLSTLLDGIGQSVSAIQQASASVDSVLALVQQAQAIASEALTHVASGAQEARITGDEDLEGVDDLPAEVGGIDNGDRLIFSFIEPDNSINAGNVVAINNGDSIDDLLDGINAIQDADSNQVFEAELTEAGFLDIREQNGNRFEIEFQTGGGAADSTLANALGFGDLTVSELDDNNAVTRVTVSSTASLTSVALFEVGGAPASASTPLIDLTDSAAGAQGDIFDGEAGDSVNVSVNGETAREVVGDIVSETLQDLVDGINNDSSLNDLIEATFDADSGELNIRAISSEVRSIQFEIVEGGAGGGTAARLSLETLGFGFQDLSPADGSGNTSSESLELAAAAGILADLEAEFGAVLSQIDLLVADSSFQNTNLLEGDTLTTFFNEDRTSSLVTEGQDVTYAALGFSDANFGRSETVGGALDEIDGATSAIESFGSSLANDLSIIETRETFTEDSITNLQEGADKLTVADQNEESARLLVLQARQILGVTALSLGSLAQQSTLRLF